MMGPNDADQYRVQYIFLNAKAQKIIDGYIISIKLKKINICGTRYGSEKEDFGPGSLAKILQLLLIQLPTLV